MVPHPCMPQPRGAPAVRSGNFLTVCLESSKGGVHSKEAKEGILACREQLHGREQLHVGVVTLATVNIYIHIYIHIYI